MSTPVSLVFAGHPGALRDWQIRMGFTNAAAARELDVAMSTYAAMLSGDQPINRRTALACAAIELGISPIDGEFLEKPKKGVVK